MKGYFLQEIYKAIQSGEIQAYYQPQYDTKKGKIGGAEALVRWIKSDGTVIPPDVFIPELESIGKVGLIDWFIAEEACKTIKMLGHMAVRISVNFGREHAKDPAFVYKLDRLVAKYGIDKKLLGVEITESDTASSQKEVINWIKRVNEAGYIIAIDDFGTGMSSLSFVKDIQAHILKIDRAFLNDNCQTIKGRAALEATFYFAHRLDLLTVVEGVETFEQLQFINSCECDFIQGYIIAEPLSKEKFIRMTIDGISMIISTSNLFENNSMYSQVKFLVKAIYGKYPFIAFSNLTQNAYKIMRIENFLDMAISNVGSYDDGYALAKSMCMPEDYEMLDAAFTRENLLAAHERGEKSVIRIMLQSDENGAKHRVAVEDFFMENDNSTDVYMVTFIHKVDFPNEVYLGNVNNMLPIKVV